MPDDWAELIASRANRFNWMHNCDRSPAEILDFSVWWSEEPEGAKFWESVYDALESEENWQKENCDLTVEQVQAIDHMVDLGAPQEWAILIAQSVQKSWRSWRELSSFGSFEELKKHRHISEIATQRFSWRKSPEGFHFWSGAYQAFKSEEQFAFENN